jgi:hypothetical protein
MVLIIEDEMGLTRVSISAQDRGESSSRSGRADSYDRSCDQSLYCATLLILVYIKGIILRVNNIIVVVNYPPKTMEKSKVANV